MPRPSIHDAFWKQSISASQRHEAARDGHTGSVEMDAARDSERLQRVPLDEGLAQERIAGRTHFLDVADLSRAVESCKFVACIRLQDRLGRELGSATGFMISPRLLLTDHHVLSSADDAMMATAWFDYEKDANGVAQSPKIFRLDPDAFFFTEANLDCSIVAVEEVAHDGTLLSDFGYTHLISDTPKLASKEALTVVQHPLGGYKQIALRNHHILRLTTDYLHYDADHHPVASGSPIFNDQWELVGLHHAGIVARHDGRVLNREGHYWDYSEGFDAVQWAGNEAIRASSIADSLKDLEWTEDEIDFVEEIFEHETFEDFDDESDETEDEFEPEEYLEDEPDSPAEIEPVHTSHAVVHEVETHHDASEKVADHAAEAQMESEGPTHTEQSVPETQHDSVPVAQVAGGAAVAALAVGTATAVLHHEAEHAAPEEISNHAVVEQVVHEQAAPHEEESHESEGHSESHAESDPAESAAEHHEEQHTETSESEHPEGQHAEPTDTSSHALTEEPEHHEEAHNGAPGEDHEAVEDIPMSEGEPNHVTDHEDVPQGHESELAAAAVATAEAESVVIARHPAFDIASHSVSGITHDHDDQVAELNESTYQQLTGYDHRFLTPDVSLPRMLPSLKQLVARTTQGVEVLDYAHFSVVMNGRRKLPFFTAANIDGNQLVEVSDQNVWLYDVRVARDSQIGADLYAGGAMDRATLVQPSLICWGALASRAAVDSKHYVNCAPQHHNLQTEVWKDLETSLLHHEQNPDRKLCTFAGPVLQVTDPIYRGIQIPLEFWKVIVFRTREDSEKALAFRQTRQSELATGGDAAEYVTLQVHVTDIERLTGLDFGPLRTHDPMIHQELGQKEIKTPGLIVL